MRSGWKPDLAAVVRHYKRVFRPRANAELDSFRSEPTLESAIARAASGRRPDGKKHSHQGRLNPGHMANAGGRLLKRLDRIAGARSFAELFDIVERVAGMMKGTDEMWAYDTALRIGAKKGTLPTTIYLHRGTRQGAKALELKIAGVKNLLKVELPGPLRELEPHEIEDALCLYKDYLAGNDADLDAVEGCRWPEVPTRGC